MPRKTNHVLDIRIWDVEHGSAAYLDAGKRNVVIDCGANTDWSPLRWIQDDKMGVKNIDYLIISHPHQDHIEDLDVMEELDLAPKIFRRPKSATEIVEGVLEDAKEKGHDDYVEDAEYYLYTLDEYDGELDVSPASPEWALDRSALGRFRTDGGIPDDGVTFHNYGSTDPTLGSEPFHKLNNLSVTTVVNSFGFQFVTMGDLMPKGIAELKENPAAMAAIENSEVLVAPHHGRDSSYDEELVEHINPDIVVCSDEGDPQNPATKEYRSHASGVEVEHENTGNVVTRYVLTTRKDGRIRIQASNPDSWTVSVYGRDYSTNMASTKRYNNLL